MTPPVDTTIRVLVVEDDFAIRLVLEDTLTEQGHEVRTAGDGLAALELLPDWIPDLILLDLTMPRLDGRGFLEARAALGPPLSRVPVILLTGVHDARSLTGLPGVSAIIGKPFDLDAMVQVVEATASAAGGGSDGAGGAASW